VQGPSFATLVKQLFLDLLEPVLPRVAVFLEITPCKGQPQPFHHSLTFVFVSLEVAVVAHQLERHNLSAFFFCRISSTWRLQGARRADLNHDKSRVVGVVHG